MTARLSKLIPMLGSDRAGEVAAAAHAIGRYLRERGKDWFDVAKILELHLVDEHLHLPGRRPWQMLAAQMLAEGQGQLSLRDENFLHTMTAWRFPPTTKQARWIDDIADKLREAA